jgi:hypothetical protein
VPLLEPADPLSIGGWLNMVVVFPLRCRAGCAVVSAARPARLPFL